MCYAHGKYRSSRVFDKEERHRYVITASHYPAFNDISSGVSHHVRKIWLNEVACAHRRFLAYEGRAMSEVECPLKFLREIGMR